MELASIFEGKDDLRLHDEASKLANAIGHWVIKNNEETPVWGLFTGASMGGELVYIKSVGAMGIDGVDDLYFGFREGGDAEAAMTIGTVEGRRAYFVIMKTEDPAPKTDIMYSIRWRYLIHELTHYIDRKRSNTLPTKDHANGSEYYNSPMEFNAYFQEGLHELLSNAKRDGVADAFPEFLRLNQICFSADWRQHMTPETKRRFLRRLYGIWTSLRSHATTADAE